MFSKPKPEESLPPLTATPTTSTSASPTFEAKPAPAPAAPPKPKPAPSVLSSDLTILGNVRSSGDIQVEGTVEGDIHAQMLIVGESSTVKGEIVADEIVVHGRVVGRVRGLKVRLSSSARCEGDIVHKTIAIESGAHFEGSVQRQDDPLGQSARETARRTPALTAAE
ncbi:MAG: polymer-forming cytoskeletal protein [Amaricoccus sp.]